MAELNQKLQHREERNRADVTIDVGSQHQINTQMDPTLAKRSMEQREKELNGNSSIAKDIHSNALAQSNADPRWLKRSEEQLQKVKTGVVAPMDIGSNALKQSNEDPKLTQARLRRLEKEEKGDDSAVQNLGPAAIREDNMDPILKTAFDKRIESIRTGHDGVSSTLSKTVKNARVSDELAEKLGRRIYKVDGTTELEPEPIQELCWEVAYEWGVNVRKAADASSEILMEHPVGHRVRGKRTTDGEWVELSGEPGFMKIKDEVDGEVLLRSLSPDDYRARPRKLTLLQRLGNLCC